MSNYVPLDEAAKKLGVNPDQLVEMLSRGDIFGYRDGASWKFKPEEIARVQQEMAGDLDEDAGGSSLLLSESDLGISGSKSGSTIGGDKSKGKSADSDLQIADGSDVALVPDPNSGSGVRLVTRGNTSKASDSDALSPIDDSDGDLQLGDDLKIAGVASSDVLGSDANLKTGSSGGTGGIGVGSGSLAGSSGALDLDGDLQLADDDEDDLVLGSGSDLALATDSGINLMSPSDSGLSLEDEPLDLAGTGISGLDLAGEGSGVSAGGSAAASGSLVDFQQDEEFQLSPSGGIEVDEDSGSQVIELEDSTEFGSAPVSLTGGDDLGGFGEDMGGGFGADDLAMGAAGAAAGAAAMRGTPDIPYNTLEIAALLGILLMFGISGIFVTDIVRNMWAWNGGTSDLTSGLTQMVIDSIGWKK